MIRKADAADISSISESYSELFRYEVLHGSSTNWADGIYPTESTAEHAFASGTLYIAETDGILCGSMILNQLQPPEYAGISWRYPASDKEVLVIHTLCIPPSEAGKGYGRKMVKFALMEAQKLSCRAVRLDTWAGNTPAAALYESMGFRLAGTAPMLLQGLIPEQQIYMEKYIAMIGDDKI